MKIKFIWTLCITDYIRDWRSVSSELSHDDINRLTVALTNDIHKCEFDCFPYTEELFNTAACKQEKLRLTETKLVSPLSPAPPGRRRMTETLSLTNL